VVCYSLTLIFFADASLFGKQTDIQYCISFFQAFTVSFPGKRNESHFEKNKESQLQYLNSIHGELKEK